MKQAIRHAPRWIVRRLTDTYVTLSVVEIAKAIASDVAAASTPEAIQEATLLILSMVCQIITSGSSDGIVMNAFVIDRAKRDLRDIDAGNRQPSSRHSDLPRPASSQILRPSCTGEDCSRCTKQ